MAHFAKIDENNIVTQVIVAEQEVIDSGILGNPEQWVQTSYNTYSGVHVLGGTPFRKNFAAVGMIWDPELDAFYSPQPYSSWTLNETTGIWEPPTPAPQDVIDADGTVHSHRWDDTTNSWTPFSY